MHEYNAEIANVWEWQIRDGMMTKAQFKGKKDELEYDGSGQNRDRAVDPVRFSMGARRGRSGPGKPVGSARVGATLETVTVDRPEPTAAAPRQRGGEKWYDFRSVRELVAAEGSTAQNPVKRANGGTGGAEKNRGIGPGAGRSNRWLNLFRRLVIR
jgi:hypothetical protein